MHVKLIAGNFPRVPASLLTRSWLESEQPQAGPSHSQPMGIPPTPPSDPSSSNRSSADHPVLSPSLYYGPLREPLIIKPEDGGFEGMGGKLPGRDLTVSDVARLVGPDRTVDVIGRYGFRTGLTSRRGYPAIERLDTPEMGRIRVAAVWSVFYTRDRTPLKGVQCHFTRDHRHRPRQQGQTAKDSQRDRLGG